METITTPEAKPSNRRRKTAKFALAGVAVVGIGAALTSAAWTDNVFFGGTAESAEFELQGFEPGTGWIDADTAPGVVIPPSAFDEVGPGISDSYDLRVRNSGDIDLQLTSVSETLGGYLFAPPAGSPADIDVALPADLVLSPGEVATIAVTVTGAVDWGNEFQGRTGSISIQVEGQSIPDPTP